MSTLFNFKTSRNEKPISIHPWQSTIKDRYLNRIKHAHNSVKNLQYPKIKEKIPDVDRIKFTVVGDRVTKEFIYCANLVNGLHKYKWKKFNVPSIRGVTSVEWEEVWRNLKLQYGDLAHCLKSRVAVLIDEKFLGGENELKELVETKYVYHLVLDYYNEAIANFASYIRCSGRPCVYMHIAVDEEHIGTLIFMLFSDVVPYTCENFLRLCKNTKGGYSGTPIHRIVKDGWVQCGGFGLKSTDLDCENFIIPHDRRGVLCMANDGRHVDCSTQFFVLLQPAPWMAHKYVAFGQLIEGEATLKKIENVPTWYESPMSTITIFKAGIFNMECQDIVVNKNANEYISGHIEDLNALGEMLIETLIERVNLEIELKMVEHLKNEVIVGEQEEVSEGTGNLHATKRFLRNKEEIERQIQITQNQDRSQNISNASDNNDFDVDEYEPEESDYRHVSLASLSLIVKQERPYYIPLTDVPYPGEVDSVYDLKKFLKGDYCLEEDLEKNIKKKPTQKPSKSLPSELFHLLDEAKTETESSSSHDLDSDDEEEVRQYIKDNVDRVSFAGGIIKSISRKYGKFGDNFKKSIIDDDQLRRLRLASVNIKRGDEYEKRVSLSVADTKKKPSQIKRRQTGFVRSEDFERIRVISEDRGKSQLGDDSDDNDKDKRKEKSTSQKRPQHKPSGFVRIGHITEIDQMDRDRRKNPKQSVLQRLYDEVSVDDIGLTLKGYRPHSEALPKSFMLTYSPLSRMKNYDDTRDNFTRHSLTAVSYENVLNLQHGKRMARKISSDYVKTIDQMENRMDTSIRTLDYAKTRPSMRVSEYQLKNLKYQERQRISKLHNMRTRSRPSEIGIGRGTKEKRRGVKLPGDTP